MPYQDHPGDGGGGSSPPNFDWFWLIMGIFYLALAWMDN
jgi:hypothetical protein